MSSLQRVLIVYDLIQRSKAKTIPEIQESLFSLHGIEVSRRTISRDIRTIRTDLGVDIQFNAAKNEFVMQDSWMAESKFNNLLNLFHLRLLNTHSKSERKLESLISFDQQSNAEAIHLVNKILYALLQQIVIEFEYTKHGSGESKTVELHPHYLKEYDYVWYVFGSCNKEHKVYGLDRISNLIFKPEVSYQPSNIDYNKRHKDYIGVNGSGELQTIQIQFSPFFSDFIKKNPLHPSQKLIKTYEDQSGVFEITVRVNNELIGQILKRDINATVLGPEKFLKQFKKLVKELHDKYA